MSFLKIRSIAHCFPEKCVSSEKLDDMLNLPQGTVLKKSGLHERYFVGDGETAAGLGAKATTAALSQGDLSCDDIDLIIGASGVAQQPIPCNAALIQAELGWQKTGIPCFDVNSTCLSFLTALNVASALLNTHQYKRILIVSSELPSKGLNWDDLDSCTIFGDGAAACIVERSELEKRHYTHQLITLSEGMNYCKIDAGGTKIPPAQIENRQDGLFHMDGQSIYKIAGQTLSHIHQSILEKANLTMDQIDYVIPHQASGLALKHARRRLKIPRDKFIVRYPTIGNQMAASIPTVLSLLNQEGVLARGQRLYLIGTGAGFAAAATILEF